MQRRIQIRSVFHSILPLAPKTQELNSKENAFENFVLSPTIFSRSLYVWKQKINLIEVSNSVSTGNFTKDYY